MPIVRASERKNEKQPRPEQVNCKNSVKAIVVDGIEKGRTVPYEQTIRLAKRRRLVTGRDAPSRVELEKRFIALVKESDDAALARLIVEAGLIEGVSFAREIEKGEPLQLAAHVHGVDIATVRDGAAKEKKAKPRKPENKKSATGN